MQARVGHVAVTLHPWPRLSAGASSGSSCASTRSARAPSRAPAIRPRACRPPTSWPCSSTATSATTGTTRRPPTNDRLVFSKGHASTLLYAILRAAGVISEEDFAGYRTFGSRSEGHPTPVLPWVDVATGSLGQGLPIGVGMAHRRQVPRPAPLSGLGAAAATARWPRARCGRRSSTPRTTRSTTSPRSSTSTGSASAARRWSAGHRRPRRARAGVRLARDRDRRPRRRGRSTGVHGCRGADRPADGDLRATLKGKGVAAVEDKNGWHGKPLDDPERARSPSSAASATCALEPRAAGAGEPHRVQDRAARAAALRARRGGRDAQGVR